MASSITKELGINADLVDAIMANESIVYSTDNFKHISQFQDVIYQCLELSPMGKFYLHVKLTRDALRDIDPHVLLNRKSAWQKLSNAVPESHLDFKRKASSLIESLNEIKSYSKELVVVKDELASYIPIVQKELDALKEMINVISSLVNRNYYDDMIVVGRIRNRLDNLSLLQTTATSYPGVLQKHIDNINKIEHELENGHLNKLPEFRMQFNALFDAKASSSACNSFHDSTYDFKETLSKLASFS